MTLCLNFTHMTTIDEMIEQAENDQLEFANFRKGVIGLADKCPAVIKYPETYKNDNMIEYNIKEERNK